MSKLQPQRVRTLGAVMCVAARLGLLLLVLKVSGLVPDDIASVFIACAMAVVIPCSLILAWMKHR